MVRARWSSAVALGVLLARVAPGRAQQPHPLPADAASPLLRVTVARAGEPVFSAPDTRSERRGTLARGAQLAVLERVQGPGCAAMFARIEARAWVCTDEAPVSAAAAVPAPARVAYDYAFATYAGVRTYRTLADVTADERAEELERGMAVAVDGSADVGGQSFAHTANGRWIAVSELRWAHPSERAGVALEAGAALDTVAFTVQRTRAVASAEEAAMARASRDAPWLAPRTPVRVREARVVRGRAVARTDAGWLRETSLRRLELRAPPVDLAPGERWVDVDTRRQTLVAYEGATPVYVALVSSGRAGHATHRGEFRVWIKLVAGDMSNERDERVTDTAALYRVERVPWVMYFDGDQALHGAYWHDAFGVPRSHGCVNLPPRDARWLFDWAPPALPSGWESVTPATREQGLRVRVR